MHLVVLLSSPPLSVVGGSRFELDTLKGDDIGVHIRRTHSQVASCTHTGGLWGHLGAFVSLGGMLDQLDDLFAVLDLCADTNHEASDPKQLSVSVDQAWWLRMHHRVDLLEGEGGAELEIVAAVASPVVGSQEEASVDSGGHLDVVAISGEVYTTNRYQNIISVSVIVWARYMCANVCRCEYECICMRVCAQTWFEKKKQLGRFWGVKKAGKGRECERECERDRGFNGADASFLKQMHGSRLFGTEKKENLLLVIAIKNNKNDIGIQQ